MSRNDDRPDAVGEGADDQNRETCWLPGFETTASVAAVNRPPLSPHLRDLAEAKGLQSLCSFLAAHVAVKDRERVLCFFVELRADRWRKLHLARREARRLAAAGAKIGGDTLPPLLVPHGYRRSNNGTRALLVAALVCAWPKEFRARVTLRDRVAKLLIQSGWRPDLPTRRKGRNR
jgi:hypothetical protein